MLRRRSTAEGEALVVPGGDIGADLPVVRHPARVRHEHARLAGNVRAEIPGVLRLRQHRGFGGRVHLAHPGLHRFIRGLDAGQTAISHMRDAVGDPLHVLLDRNRHVAEYRRTAGSGDGEQVRKARNLQAEIIARPRRPGLRQRQVIAPADVHPQQRAGHPVEAGGEDDDIQRIRGIARADSPWRDLFDRIGPDIHQRDIVAVESLEIIGVDRRALCRVGVVDVGQFRRRRRVFHDIADLRADELGSRGVRRVVRHQVAEGGAESQLPCPPGCFIQGLPLFG